MYKRKETNNQKESGIFKEDLNTNKKEKELYVRDN